MIHSGSIAFLGVFSPDGTHFLEIQSSGAYVQQPITFTPGSTNVLTLSAASRYDGIAALTVYEGATSLTVVQPLRSTSMAMYAMWFVADASSKRVPFTNTCGYGCSSMVFVDAETLQQGKGMLKHTFLLFCDYFLIFF